jgi:gas vesicle protein
MKLTKSQLKQIIKEELQKEMIAPHQKPEEIEAVTPEEDKPTDLASMVSAMMPEIQKAVAGVVEKYLSSLEKIKRGPHD